MALYLVVTLSDDFPLSIFKLSVSQQGFLTVGMGSKGEKHKYSFDIYTDIKINVALFLVASPWMPFSDERTLLENSLLTC